jgi:hypothetical protein
LIKNKYSEDLIIEFYNRLIVELRNETKLIKENKIKIIENVINLLKQNNFDTKELENELNRLIDKVV